MAAALAAAVSSASLIWDPASAIICLSFSLAAARECRIPSGRASGLSEALFSFRCCFNSGCFFWCIQAGQLMGAGRQAPLNTA